MAQKPIQPSQISITKSDIGLSNVDNTSDAAKPISTAVQTALDTKAAASAVTTLNGEVDALQAVNSPWQSYTPTLTNITLGNGTLTAKYKESHGTIFFEVCLVFGSTTTLATVANYTQSPRVSLPVTGVCNSWTGVAITGYSGAVMPCGARMSFDQSAAQGSGSANSPQWYDANNFYDSSLSASATNLKDPGDRITWSACYEKA